MKDDVVVTLGQDGLVANTAKYAGAQPIVAVNPEPSRFDGILLPFLPDQARTAVGQVLDLKAAFREVTLADATLNGCADQRTATMFRIIKNLIIKKLISRI